MEFKSNYNEIYFNEFGELWRRWFRRKQQAKPTTNEHVGESVEPKDIGGL